MCSSTKTVQLNGGVNGGSQSGTWTSSGTGTFVPSASNLAATYSISQSDILAGTITLSLTSTNNGVCAPVVSSVPLVIKQQPTVNAGPDKTICSNSLAVNLSATVTGVTNTGIWNTDGAGTLSNNTSLTPGYSFTPADVTKGKVRFFISSTNNDLCPSSYDTLAINIIKFPVLILKSDTTICEKNNRIWLSPGITGGSGQLKWTSTGTGSFIPNNYSAPTNYQISAQDSKAGNVVLSVSSIENGPCGNVSTSLKVKINPSPTAGFAASTYTVILPADAVIFTNQSAGATIHRWDFGDGTGSSAVSPSKKYREVGYYNVRLIVKNELQCADTTERLITVISSIKLPTAFTPNGDKLNDTFHPYTAGVVEYDLMIFNRWGELIFRSTDINVGWDGTFNGKPCQQDAYVWKADMKFFDGRTFSDTGSITLIR
jgi:gliding motility-associated-like protein